MAHQVETMAYANAVPWHGLGARVADTLTPDEMLKAAGLDWEVEKRPLYTSAPDGSPLEVENRKALVRASDNRVFSVVSDGWCPLQNREALGFMREYVSAGAATLETAGALNGGRIVWGLAKLAHDFEVRPGDKIGGYLLFTSPHEVGKAISIRTTTIRVVCANTMALAMGNGDEHYRQNHMSEFDADAARERIGMAHEHLARAERNGKILDGLKLNAEDAINKVLAPVFSPKLAEEIEAGKPARSRERLPKSIRDILNSIDNAPGATPGTAWGVMNGVTHFLDHVIGESRGADARMTSSWVGHGAKRKVDVEQRLLELAE